MKKRMLPYLLITVSAIGMRASEEPLTSFAGALKDSIFSTDQSRELPEELVALVKKTELPFIWAHPTQEKLFTFTSPYTPKENFRFQYIANSEPASWIKMELLRHASDYETYRNNLFEKAQSLTYEESLWESFKEFCLCCCFQETEEEIEHKKNHVLGMSVLTYLNVLHAFEALENDKNKKNE